MCDTLHVLRVFNYTWYKFFNKPIYGSYELKFEMIISSCMFKEKMKNL